MRAMVGELLQLRVITRLPNEDARRPFVAPAEQPGDLRVWEAPQSLRPVFSTYFLVPKHDSGFRGCLDLRYVNRHVVC
eukprot:SAG11_NODE_5224_length_1624_cov_5.638689_1_plen_77_part_10